VHILKARRRRGFTIVELLIVIVVIGILAAITIVAFNGVQNKAKATSMMSDLESTAKQMEIYKLTTSSTNTYPPDITTANVKASNGASYTYYNNIQANTYCLTETNGTLSYYVATNVTPQAGTCLVANGLVGWWNFNGNSNDSSGKGFNGTNYSVTATIGQNGQANSAYSFNGSSSYITLPNTAAITGNNPYTLSAWIQLNDLTTHHGILGWGSWGTSNTVTAFRTQNESGIIGLRVYWWGNDLAGSAPFIADGNWHLALTEYDGSTRKIFVDGVMVSSDNTSNNNAIANDVAIGRTDGVEYFAGSIDDVRIYNRALSNAEIQSLYTAGAQ
jgi:prepilin-type N-terminal cleavage/methylation domain-containing protein